MPVSSMDTLVACLTGGTRKLIAKASMTSEGAGLVQSLWKAAGDPPAGATPPAFNAGSGYIPTKATTGAFTFSNPTAPALSYLARFEALAGVPGMLIVYDRLWHCSGFGAVSTSLQSITTPGTLPSGRDPNTGADVEPWLEVHSAPGATGATWTVTGTDALGNTGRTWQYTHPANAETVGQMMQLLPGGGSPASVLGMQAPASFQASVSSGTAGDVGLVLLRRIAMLPLPLAFVSQDKDGIQLGLPRVYDDSCLALMVGCTSTTTGIMLGNLIVGQN